MAPEAGRLGDNSKVSGDGHGCPACPHTAVGPAILGSPNVYVNGKPALRVDDKGVHAACCGPNMWTATAGAPHVFINSKAAHRKGDDDAHCGATGQLIQGSNNVFVGDGGGGGGGGGKSGGLGPKASVAGKIAKEAGKTIGKAALGAAGELLKGNFTEFFRKIGAKSLSGFAKNGLGKALGKLKIPPVLQDKLQQIAGPIIDGVMDDLVHGRAPSLSSIGDDALTGLVDIGLDPLQDLTGKLDNLIETELLEAMGPASDKLGNAVHGAIAGALGGAVGGAIDGAVSGSINAGIRGRNPGTGALDGLKSESKSGAGEGAWDGGKGGWKSSDFVDRKR